MDIWNDIGITGNNASEHKCFEKAYLLVSNQSGIVKKPFKFERIANDSYVEMSSIMNMEYTKTNDRIFTPFYWLPFVRNARVEFEDGSQLTIKDIAVVRDSEKALDSGNSKKGVELTF